MRIGELAKRTKISVRTLHYYDKIGLVSPSCRSDSGHRLYAEADILKLQKVILLRSLSLSLDEIARIIEDSEFSALQILESHIDSIKNQLLRQQSLLAKLESLAANMRAKQAPALSQLIKLLEGMNIVEKNFYNEDYINSIQGAIRSKWKPSQSSSEASALVSFTISKDGGLQEINLDESSGFAEYDKCCLEAVKLSAPFDNLPMEEKSSIKMQFAFGKKREHADESTQIANQQSC